MNGYDNNEFYRKAAYSKIGIGDIFSDVFKKHTKTDGEKLFIAGTYASTPAPGEMLSTWTKPWLFFRVFGLGFVILIMLYIMIYQGYFNVAINTFSFIGSAIVPVAVLLLYWEMNIPRNIPIYEVVLMFFIGGLISLLYTIIFNNIVGDVPAYMAPLTEEPAKLIALALFLQKPKKKYLLNGILIGGAIGAGFAVIETTGYFFGNYNVDLLVIRAVLSPGAHVAWAAMYGGALALAKKGEKLQGKHFLDTRFLLYFAAAFVFHFIWNDDRILILSVPLFLDVKFILLIVAVWICLMNLFRMGVQQVMQEVGALTAYQNAAEAAPAGMPVREAVRASSLYCICGVYAGMSIPLSNGMLRLGRDATVCNLMFPKDIKGISRKHCSVSFDGQTVWLSDEGSSYGTFLDNGTRVTVGSRVAMPIGSRFYLVDRSNVFEVR